MQRHGVSMVRLARRTLNAGPFQSSRARLAWRCHFVHDPIPVAWSAPGPFVDAPSECDCMSARRILVLFNPISGAGRAGRMAEGSRQALAAAGHDVIACATRATEVEAW